MFAAEGWNSTVQLDYPHHHHHYHHRRSSCHHPLQSCSSPFSNPHHTCNASLPPGSQDGHPPRLLAASFVCPDFLLDRHLTFHVPPPPFKRNRGGTLNSIQSIFVPSSSTVSPYPFCYCLSTTCIALGRLAPLLPFPPLNSSRQHPHHALSSSGAGWHPRGCQPIHI